MKEEDQKTVEQVLGEPVLPEFSEELRRIKRNLLVIASAAIFAQVEPDRGYRIRFFRI